MSTEHTGPAAPANRKLVLHLITGLSTGGAEMMLYKLLSRLDQTKWDAVVVSMLPPGHVKAGIARLGIPVYSLNMHRGTPDPRGLLRLVRILRRLRPAIIQTWMYHADLLGGIGARLGGTAPVIWGLRQSDFDPVESNRATVYIARICARLSSWLPATIVCCSQKVAAVHSQLGYASERMRVIPNGFEVNRFEPNAVWRSEIRDELELSLETPLLGLVARFHPMKDHRSFVRAAGIALKKMPTLRFLMCGEGITWDNKVLADWIRCEGIEHAFHLLGNRDDVHRIYPALDLYVSSSAYGEGFPNVLGEAMACGVPCVATDVGDSGLILGDTGWIVKPRDPALLAAAMLQGIESGRDERARRRARERILECFRIETIARKFESVYAELLSLP